MGYARESRDPEATASRATILRFAKSRWVPKKAPVYRGGEIIAWKVVAS